MANLELGAKRQCQNCGTKFFDFNRDRIVCPKCGTVFEAVPVARSAPRAAPVREEVEAEVDPVTVETVSLDEVEASEKVEATAEDEIEVEDEPADTFLEEEDEENDDVTGLIDGDIDPDEEG